MPTFTHGGEFCPNETCPDYGKLQSAPGQENIKKAGKTEKGRQRSQCKTCGQPFTDTKGTLFYRRRTSEEEIIATLAWVAAGVRISSLARSRHHKEDPMLDWIREAARHAQALEEVLLAAYQLNRGQLDALWSYVGNKGGKKTLPKRSKAGSSGVPP